MQLFYFSMKCYRKVLESRPKRASQSDKLLEVDLV